MCKNKVAYILSVKVENVDQHFQCNLDGDFIEDLWVLFKDLGNQ